MERDEFMSGLAGNFDDALKIVERKNMDYADGADPFQNFRMVENTGLVSVEQGIAVRMTDKMQRIINLLEDEPEVADESLEDSLLDLINYSNIMLLYLKEERDN